MYHAHIINLYASVIQAKDLKPSNDQLCSSFVRVRNSNSSILKFPKSPFSYLVKLLTKV